MLSRTRKSVPALALLVTLAAPAIAVPVYDESVAGDLSNNRAAPTPVSFTVGENDVFGQTGSTAGVTDRDYFTFLVPAESLLTSIIVLNSSLSAGGAAFFGLQQGPVITVDPALATAAPLLGYELVSPSDIGTDILPVMATAAGAGGFAPPLRAGQYSAWIQDTNIAPSVYGLRFVIASVPEPGSAVLLAAGIFVLAGVARRKSGGQPQR